MRISVLFPRFLAVICVLSAGLASQARASEMVSQISASLLGQCVRTQAGNVYCWGDNDAGQIGNGIRDPKGGMVTKPTRVHFPEGQAAYLSAEGDDRCIIDPDHRLFCWGWNRDGLLGFPPQEKFVLVPKLVPGIGQVRTVAIAAFTICVVDMEGQVSCWGSNQSGQLGNGTTKDSATPVQVSLPEKVKELANYLGSICALTERGRLFCWGNNDHGKLGLGIHDPNVTVPFEVTGFDSRVTQVSLEQDNSCALTEKGTVYCWGLNFYGSLGNGKQQNVDFLVPGQVIGLKEPAVKVASGWTSCAVMQSGKINCWGFNEYGTLGDGTLMASALPVETKLSEAAVDVWSNGLNTCALSYAGAVYCWGSNYSGFFGTPDTNEKRAVPKEVLIP